MTTQRVSCMKCAQVLLIPTSTEQRAFRCPKCKTTIAVEQPSEATPARKSFPVLWVAGILLVLWVSGMVTAALVVYNRKPKTPLVKAETPDRDAPKDRETNENRSGNNSRKPTAKPLACSPWVLARTRTAALVKSAEPHLTSLPEQFAVVKPLLQDIRDDGTTTSGLATSRPFGWYVCLHPEEVGANEIVFMLPLEDRATFDNFLVGEAAYDFKQAGSWKELQSRTAGSMYLKCADNYAYFVLVDTGRKPRFALLEPSALEFDNSQQELAVDFYFDRFSPALLERTLNNYARNNLEKKEIELVVGYVKTFFRETKSCSLTAGVDAWRKRLIVDGQLIPKEDTDLAQRLRAMNESTSLFADWPKANALFQGSIHCRLPRSFRNIFVPRKEDFPREFPGLPQPLSERDVQQFLDVYFPTIDAGELDAATVALPDPLGGATVLGALKLVHARNLERAIKEMPNCPLDLGVARINDVPVHRTKQKGGFPIQFGQALATHHTYFAFRDDALFVATGREQHALALLERAMSSRPRPAPLVRISAINRPENPLYQKQPPKDAEFRLEITGGNQLQLRAELPVMVDD